MIDLLLIHPPHPRFMPNMTLPSLKQYLESKKFSVLTLEHVQSNQEVLEAVRQHTPRYIGISVPFTFYGPSGQELLHFLKQNTDIPVAVGGAHVIVCPDDFKEADFICRGHGEHYLLKLLSGETPTPGLDMDDLPWIYIEHGDVYNDGRIHTRYLSARGCVFNCNFCSIKYLSDGRVHFRSIPKVIDDLKKFKEQGIKNIIFCDECFTINRKRTEEMCHRIIEEHLEFHWYCVTRASLIDYDLALLLKQAGCWCVGFGVESADPEQMKKIGKNITLDQMRAGIQACHKAGLLVYGGFIIGFPGDTEESIDRSLRFAIDSGLDFAGFGCLFPFPGTRVRQEAIEHGGYIQDDWSKFHYGNATYVPTSLETQGFDAKKIMRLNWYCNGRFILSSTRRLWFNFIGFARQKGWRPKADFLRRILYGLSRRIQL